MKSNFNPKKEFNRLLNSITREFMLERCKLYRVQHRKNEDTLEILCYKYIRKRGKMKPWEIPDDENGNAGWVNPIRILEDDAIKLKFAGLINNPYKSKLEEILKERINYFNDQLEEFELMEEMFAKYGKYIPKEK